MENQYTPLFNEAIRVERNISSFYALCAAHFKDDQLFWQMLSEEEEHHAKILESGLELLLEQNLFPDAILDLDIKELKETNSMLEEKIAESKERMPDKKDAYTYALELEQASLEFFFQQTVSDKADEKAIKVFDNLVGFDKDHAQRIHDLIDTTKFD
jgi:rubrerythrin